MREREIERRSEREKEPSVALDLTREVRPSVH